MLIKTVYWGVSARFPPSLLSSLFSTLITQRITFLIGWSPFSTTQVKESQNTQQHLRPAALCTDNIINNNNTTVWWSEFSQQTWTWTAQIIKLSLMTCRKNVDSRDKLLSVSSNLIKSSDYTPLAKCLLSRERRFHAKTGANM